MSTTPKPVSKLVEAFARLPGIGSKTASRLTYYLLRRGPEEAQALADALANLHGGTLFCSICCNISESDPCPVCSDAARDRTTICVVEEPLDVQAIENTGAYDGLYHVLHGHISPMDRIGPDDLRMAELITRVKTGAVKEVIVATNPTLEGDATAMYLAETLAPFGARVSRLALGLPRGGDLEYADRVTLAESLAGRRAL